MAIYKAPRGTHDIFGQLALALEKLDMISRKIFKKHNFKEVKTPIFEDVNLFTRSIGESTDIVEKEMYVFEDRKGRKLALRPEGTASLVRAYIEHNFNQTEPVGKFFYSGEMADVFPYKKQQDMDINANLNISYSLPKEAVAMPKKSIDSLSVPTTPTSDSL